MILSDTLCRFHVLAIHKTCRYASIVQLLSTSKKLPNSLPNNTCGITGSFSLATKIESDQSLPK